MTLTPTAASYLDAIESAFEPHRDPEAAAPMKAYMRDQFEFIGIGSPVRSQLLRHATAGLDPLDQRDLESLSRSLWAKAERDYQYAAVSIVRRNQKKLDESFIDTAEHLIVTKSWWDTVDDLAQNTVGPIVLRHDRLVAVMDTWIDDDDIWLARTAVLHQNRYQTATDPERLFRYCLARAGDQEFFIRKAIGWALRDYSKTDEAAVRRFVADHDRELSGLSKREALKWLERRAARAATT